jgi:hypothetical protein
LEPRERDSGLENRESEKAKMGETRGMKKPRCCLLIFGSVRCVPTRDATLEQCEQIINRYAQQ